MALIFEWDEAKNAANRRKHGISFEDAIKAFHDPLSVTEFERIENGEQRWQTFGFVSAVLLVMVAHTWRDEAGDEFIRVISARFATPKERRDHERKNR